MNKQGKAGKFDKVEIDHSKPKKEKLVGVKGWLWLFAIILIVISPMLSLYDISLYPEFYFYESGVFDYTSLIYIIAFSIWSIIVGLAIVGRKSKAIIWAKEYLIALTVFNVVITFWTLGLFSEEEQIILFSDVARSIGFFLIWFSYLNVSQRVKNTFKKRKLNWKRVVLIIFIVFGVYLFFLITSSFLFTNIDNSSQSLIKGQDPIKYTLEGNMVQYHEFVDQSYSDDVNVKFDSVNGIMEIYLVKSQEDYDSFVANEEFNVYEGCFNDNSYSGEISCTVSTGGIMVYNPNDYEIVYTLETS